jgi:hypothetical protein
MTTKFTPVYLSFFFIFICSQAYNQHLDESDSLLMKKYWNRVVVKSVSSINNNLYTGIDNYLTLVCPDKESSEFTYFLSSNNGDIYEYDQGTYLTIPARSGRSFISVNVITEENDTLLIGKKQFSVMNLPSPCLKIGNTVINDNSVVNKNIFYGNDTLKVYFSDDLPESLTWYNIERFSMGFTISNLYKSVENEGPIFKQQTLKLIDKPQLGVEYVIKILSVAPSGLLRNLPLVHFRLQ